MFTRFTAGSRRVLEKASEEARGLGHGYLGTEHLLLGLLADQHAPAGRVLAAFGVDRARVGQEVERILRGGPPVTPDAEALESIGIDLDAVRRRVEEAFGPGALERARIRPPGRRRRFRRWNRCTRPGDGTGTSLTPRSKKVLELAFREALALHHSWIGPEHILLGIVREGEGLAAEILARLTPGLPAIRTRMLEALDGLADSG